MEKEAKQLQMIDPVYRLSKFFTKCVKRYTFFNQIFVGSNIQFKSETDTDNSILDFESKYQGFLGCPDFFVGSKKRFSEIFQLSLLLPFMCVRRQRE